MVDFPPELPLSSDRLYAYELAFVPAKASDEDDSIVERARLGDPDAKERFIISCLRYVSKVAADFYKTMPHGLDEYLDLVGVGNLAVVEHVDEVLVRAKVPAAYIRIIARQAMWRHCKYRSWLVALPEHRSAQGKSPFVASLDALVGTGDSTYMNIIEAQLALLNEVSGTESQVSDLLLAELHEAIDTVLTPTERKVVMMYYGLDGQGEHESLREVSRILSHGKTNIASNMHRRAILKLRRHLERFVS